MSNNSSLSELVEISKNIKKSSIIPIHLRNENELLAAMIFVQELGLPIISGLQNVAVIQGKPTLNSHALWALVMKQSDLKKVEVISDDKKAIVKISRSIGDFESSFSMEDARKAGLVKDNSGWIKYPKQMLEARAKSLCARLAYPESLFGVYATEELRDAEPFNNYEPKEVYTENLHENKSSLLDSSDQVRKQNLEIKKIKQEINQILQTQNLDKTEIEVFVNQAKENLALSEIKNIEEASALLLYTKNYNFSSSKTLEDLDEFIEDDFMGEY